MKRVLALVLTLSLVFSVFSLRTSAAGSAEVDADPVVFLLGFSTADLYYNDGVSDTRERVWNLTADDISERIMPNLPKALWGLFKALVFKDYGTLNEAAAAIAEPVLEKMERLTMLPDGTSKYDLSVFPSWVTDTFAYMKSYRNVYLSGIYRALLEEYSRVYVFVADWRYGQVELAQQLDEYIQQVKRDSGKDKVTLFGFSQGGQTISTYLYCYGDKQDVKRVVMETPAIGGTSFAAAVLDGSLFSVQTDSIFRFGEAYMGSEKHYEFFGKLLNINPLKNSILSIAMTHVLPIARYWGSLWDLVPAKDYDRLKAQYLSDPACAPLVERSDRYHYEILPAIGEKLRALKADGLPISIVCNTGNPVLVCSDAEGDGILDAANVSGATVAEFGTQFKTLTPAGTVCTDPSHYHFSPSLSVDASSCYLPENTWFVDGQFHGQSDWDPYTYSLLKKLLMTDSLSDVYADAAYPQFEYAQSPADQVHISFVQTGSYTGGDAVTVTNLSQTHAIKIHSVMIRASKQTVCVPRKTVLQPGESVTMDVSGNAGPNGTYTPVVVIFSNTDEKVPLLRSKTFRTSVYV